MSHVRPPWSMAFAVFLLLFCPVEGAAREPLDRAYDALSAVVEFHSTVISPDGRRVAWVEALEGTDSRIFVQGLEEGARPRAVTASTDGKTHRERDAAFSPDGTLIAFCSNAGAGGKTQLYVVALGGGSPRRVTDVAGTIGAPRFSPDGRSLAFLLIEGARKDAGPLGPTSRDSGVVEETVDEQRIAIVDLASGRLRLVTPADLYVYEYDWSPDGKTFAFSGAHGAGDDNWWIAELFLADVATGATRSLAKPALQIACPRFSPDGRSVAYVGGLMSDFGSNGGDVWIVSVSGGALRNLTPARPSSAASLWWLASSGHILFVENVNGETALASLDPESGEVAPLWKSPEAIASDGGASISVARDGRTSAAIRQSFTSPPEVWAGPIGAWRRVTSRNAGARALWGKAENLEWESDGHRVQGWLIYPQDYDKAPSGTRWPMAVNVHGGPASVNRPTWPSSMVGGLTSQGYFVFLPNPRGSFGQGEEFTEGNVKDFGYGDLRDVLRGMDEVGKRANVDPKRVGIFGWSYGGYLTMWAVTQTDRFAAAVAGAGIVNWQSYYGQNRIDKWMLPYFGATVYDDPAIYARSSPITFIRKAKTPTLVLHGERDAEVPAPQGYEFWHALKTLGVPTRLVIYPDEGHRFTKPEHKKDRVRQIVSWFDMYLK